MNLPDSRSRRGNLKRDPGVCSPENFEKQSLMPAFWSEFLMHRTSDE